MNNNDKYYYAKLLDINELNDLYINIFSQTVDLCKKHKISVRLHTIGDTTYRIIPGNIYFDLEAQVAEDIKDDIIRSESSFINSSDDYKFIEKLKDAITYNLSTRYNKFISFSEQDIVDIINIIYSLNFNKRDINFEESILELLNIAESAGKDKFELTTLDDEVDNKYIVADIVYPKTELVLVEQIILFVLFKKIIVFKVSADKTTFEDFTTDNNTASYEMFYITDDLDSAVKLLCQDRGFTEDELILLDKNNKEIKI